MRGAIIRVLSSLAGLTLAACDVPLPKNPIHAPPVIITTTLVEGKAGEPYQVILTAEGGEEPLQWSLSQIPPDIATWLHIDSGSGALTGTPMATIQPAQSFTVQLQDSVQRSASKVLFLAVRSCDEGATSSCSYTQANACYLGQSICVGGAMAPCSGSLSTAVSQCDGNCQPCGPNADRCVAGRCQCGPGASPCTGGATCCGESCHQLNSAVQNCGSCGNVCAGAAQASPVCVQGSCGISCTPGFGNCDGSSANGCETPLNSTSNCGGCGNRCSAGTNEVASCVNGACQKRCAGETCDASCCAPGEVCTLTCTGKNESICRNQCQPPPTPCTGKNC